jgi:putative nucleotide binding protein
MEEYAYIIDYLPQGRAEDKNFRKSPLIIAIGENEFKLLEIVPKPDAVITVGDRIYIGKSPEKRDKVISIKRRITFKELTSAAVSELPYAIENIIDANPKRFIDFFNNAEAVNTRMHTLELLPGLGNKSMWSILDERKNGPFTSFDDIMERVKSVHNPKKMLVNRIMDELQNRYEKYKLFVAK